MSVWCPCANGENQIALRGRLVSVFVGGATVARAVLSVCVRCTRAQLDDGAVVLITSQERLALTDVMRRVAYARDAINRKIDVDADNLPTVEQFSEMGHVRPIRTDAFPVFSRATSDPDIRAHMRGLFNIPAGASHVAVNVPGLRTRIVIGDDFVEHPIIEQRRRDDPDHMNCSVLAPQTVLAGVEIFRVRRGKTSSFVFLGAYVDLSAPESTRGRYIYHVAYALGDGRLNTSFRLNGGAQAFRTERTGRLLFAAYAVGGASLVLPSAS